MKLCENILKLRSEKNMSQLDLADALGVSRQSVSKWETGTAVPELDKLVKMAKLFDVNLDELVTGEVTPRKEAQASTEVPEPKVIYVEKPVFREIKREYRIGSAFLACSLIYALILCNGRFGAVETLIMVLPLAACGIMFFLTSNPLFWCGWIGTAGYWSYLLILFHRWEEQTPLIILGAVIVIFLILRTLHLRKTGKIRIPFGIMVLGGIILFLLLILLCVNTISFTLFTTEHSSIPIPR